MNYHDIKVGDRVKIHPASDWFMRGIKYGTVISKRMGVVRVKPDNRDNLRIKFLTNAPRDHEVKDLLPL